MGVLIGGCTPKVVVKPLNVAERYPTHFECPRADGSNVADVRRPAIPPEELGERLVESIRARELVVTTYLLAVEAANFKCWDNMQWQKDFYSKLPKE